LQDFSQRPITVFLDFIRRDDRDRRRGLSRPLSPFGRPSNQRRYQRCFQQCLQRYLRWLGGLALYLRDLLDTKSAQALPRNSEKNNQRECEEQERLEFDKTA